MDKDLIGERGSNYLDGHKRFIWNNIICHFDIPHSNIIDNGSQFVGKDLARLFEKCHQVAHVHAPISVGQWADQGVQQNLLDCLKKSLSDKKGKWPDELPGVLGSILPLRDELPVNLRSPSLLPLRRSFLPTSWCPTSTLYCRILSRMRKRWSET